MAALLLAATIASYYADSKEGENRSITTEKGTDLSSPKAALKAFQEAAAVLQDLNRVLACAAPDSAKAADGPSNGAGKPVDKAA
jgi:hypothetical protein